MQAPNPETTPAWTRDTLRDWAKLLPRYGPGNAHQVLLLYAVYSDMLDHDLAPAWIDFDGRTDTYRLRGQRWVPMAIRARTDLRFTRMNTKRLIDAGWLEVVERSPDGVLVLPALPRELREVVYPGKPRFSCS